MKIPQLACCIVCNISNVMDHFIWNVGFHYFRNSPPSTTFMFTNYNELSLIFIDTRFSSSFFLFKIGHSRAQSARNITMDLRKSVTYHTIPEQNEISIKKILVSAWWSIAFFFYPSTLLLLSFQMILPIYWVFRKVRGEFKDKILI